MKYIYPLLVCCFIGFFTTIVFAQTDSLDISIAMDGSQAGISSSGVGTELGTGTSGCYYVNSTNTLYIKFQFTGLTGTTTVAHIHGPAAAGASAGPIQTLTGLSTGVTSGTYNASFVLDATNETRLLSNLLYINIHTSFAGGGEIRGQLINTNTYLPVELTSFIAIVNGGSVELVWKTATEVNNHGFEVERMELNHRIIGSMNQWERIGFIEGNGTTNAPQSYSFTDASARGTVQYRLKQIDRDGKFEYSSTVEAVVARTVTQYGLDQNYPNPFNPATRIQYQIPVSGFVSLKVYDMLGKEVAALVNGVRPAGEYAAEFDASTLPSGIYFYSLRSDKFTSTKKMLLMK